MRRSLRPLLGLAFAAVAMAGARWWASQSTDAEPSPAPHWVMAPLDPLANADGGVRSLSGRVVWGEDARPAAGAQVEVFPAQPTPLLEATCGQCRRPVFECTGPDTVAHLLDAVRSGRAWPRALAVGVADAEGAFHLEGVPRGSVRVVARFGGSAVSEEAPSDQGPALVLSVLPPTRREVTVSSAGGKSEHGEPEPPLSGAQVTWWNLDTGDVARAQADGEGHAAAALPEGRVWVAAEAAGHGPEAAFWTDDQALALRPLRTLFVHTWSEGEPVEAQVTLEDEHPSTARSRGGLARFTVRSGGASLRAEAHGLVAQVDDLVLAESGDTHLTAELRPGGRVLVATLDEAGQPVEGATLTLRQGAVAVTGGSTADGALVALGPLGVGPAVLLVEAPALRRVERHFVVRPGPQELEVVLRARVLLRGRVVGLDGKPAANVALRARAPNGDMGRSSTARSTADGTFTLTVAEAGTWVVDAQSDEGRAQGEFAAPGDDALLALTARATLEVTVRGPRGEPVRALCRLSDEGGREPVQHVMTDAEGRVRLGGLPPGDWEVEVTAEGFTTVVQRLRLEDGQVGRREVQLEPGAEIRGVVVDQRGAPQAAMLVRGGDTTTTTEDDGSFVLKGRRAGEEVAVTVLTRTSDETRVARARVLAPATGVRLTIDAATTVRGRVVGAGDRPVPTFLVDETDVSDPAGRFDVETRAEAVTVKAPGHRPRTVTVPGSGDVGVVTLEALPRVEGQVLLPSGRPAAGARVWCSSVETVTGPDGRFSARPNGTWEVRRLSARLGPWEAEQPVVGGAPVTLRLTGPAQVRGRLAGVTAGGAGAVVEAYSLESMRPLRVEAAEDGTFLMVLSPGKYTFSTRALMGAQVVDVTHDGQEVVLGQAGPSCAVRVEAPEPMQDVLLWPEPKRLVDKPEGLGPEDLPNGAVWLQPLEGRLFVVGDHLACGAWQVMARAGGRQVVQRVVLEPGMREARVELTLPPVVK